MEWDSRSVQTSPAQRLDCDPGVGFLPFWAPCLSLPPVPLSASRGHCATLLTRLADTQKKNPTTAWRAVGQSVVGSWWNGSSVVSPGSERRCGQEQPRGSLAFSWQDRGDGNIYLGCGVWHCHSRVPSGKPFSETHGPSPEELGGTGLGQALGPFSRAESEHDHT